jgi:UTP pyrophosphatase
VSYLLQRYPQAHTVRTDRALYDYVAQLRANYLRKAAAIDKVVFDNKIHVIRNALGLHTSLSRVQGNKLRAAHEIRIAAMFKFAPPEFLRMICVHELAHLKERHHDRAFYKLCLHMEPDYLQLEQDVRRYAAHLDAGGARLWGPDEGRSVSVSAVSEPYPGS